MIVIMYGTKLAGLMVWPRAWVLHDTSALKRGLLLAQRQALDHVDTGSLRFLHVRGVAPASRVVYRYDLV